MFIVFFLLFLAAGLIKLLSSQFTEAAILLGLCAITGFFMGWVTKENEQAVEFLKWIRSKQEDLNRGWTFYRGQKITLNTEVTQYQGCISFLAFTTRFRSRYMVVENGNAGIWLMFTALTFAFGWWGLPWGLICTPIALYRNFRGGHRQPVSQLLANIDEEIDKLTSKKRKTLSAIFSEAKAEARA